MCVGCGGMFLCWVWCSSVLIMLVWCLWFSVCVVLIVVDSVVCVGSFSVFSWVKLISSNVCSLFLCMFSGCCIYCVSVVLYVLCWCSIVKYSVLSSVWLWLLLSVGKVVESLVLSDWLWLIIWVSILVVSMWVGMLGVIVVCGVVCFFCWGWVILGVYG